MPGSVACCPKCHSTNVSYDAGLSFKGYGPGLAACRCGCLWEPYRVRDLLDDDAPLSSFTEPCNNCAFRPGSPEQDPEKWRDLIQQLKDGATFYCHKGVPIESDAAHGFAYPYKEITIEGRAVQVHDKAKLRLCRGYLRALRQWSRA